ncbi:hypothetical protein CFPU101_36440 [Chroococcus sp. FPU101]|nr:hypothetical protein CFPU101_36440 [Chroococcus sp. FPU101]
MFRYFARLHEKYVLPIYPVVIFSDERPKKAAVSSYQIKFPDFQVLDFNYRTIQLNRLNWRDFLNQPNPIASALMAKMKIEPKDRPKVKAECLRLLVTLKLNPAKTQLISGFIDSYLKLTATEIQAFETELGTFGQSQQEEVMQIVTSWTIQGQVSTIIRLLKRKFGQLSPEIEAKIQNLSSPQLDDLTETLLDFQHIDDLTSWLSNLEE